MRQSFILTSTSLEPQAKEVKRPHKFRAATCFPTLLRCKFALQVPIIDQLFYWAAYLPAIEVASGPAL